MASPIEGGPRRLEMVQRFMISVVERRATTASAELSVSAVYHVPGRSPVAGTFAGRQSVIGQFQRVFELASTTDVVKWVDWMVGTDLVSALARVHLQSGLTHYQVQLLFLFSFTPSGAIDVIRLFPEDQVLFDRFFVELPEGDHRGIDR